MPKNYKSPGIKDISRPVVDTMGLFIYTDLQNNNSYFSFTKSLNA